MSANEVFASLPASYDTEIDRSSTLSSSISEYSNEFTTGSPLNGSLQDILQPRMHPHISPLTPDPKYSPTIQQYYLTLEHDSAQRLIELGVPFTPVPLPCSESSRTMHGLRNRSETPSKREQIQLDFLWQDLQRLLIDTWSLRSKIHGRRDTLRAKQYTKSAADDKYFQYARRRQFSANSETEDADGQAKKMEELLLDCQRARDDCGPLEDECSLLEDRLSYQEFQLRRLEERFYQRLVYGVLQNSEEVDSRSEQSLSNLGIQSNVRMPELARDGDIFPVQSPSESIYSDSDLGDISHPLLSKFLSRMGDVDILQEHLEWQVEEKHVLEMEKETRRRVGLDLAPEAQDWLNNYEQENSKLRAEIRVSEEEAEKLKQQCLSLGLVDNDGSPTQFESQEQHSFVQEVDSQGEVSDYIKYPILLPNPGKKELEFHDNAPRPHEKSDSAGDHINQWLLHRLRSSPLDVNLLARTFELNVGSISEQWQLDVLAFWYHDGAIKGPEAYRNDSANVTIEALPLAHNRNSSPSSSNIMYQRQSWRIFLKSSSLHSNTKSEYAFVISTSTSIRDDASRNSI